MTPSAEDLSTVFRLYSLREVFRPAVPIDDLKLFRGRERQLDSVMTGIQELGQHVVIYGERGLGKTSLAYVARAVFLAFAERDSLAIRVQCAEGDTFDSLWKRFGRRLTEEIDLKEEEYKSSILPTLRSSEEVLLYTPGELTPEDVARALKPLAQKTRMLILVDEVDRLTAKRDNVAISDLVKNLSDEVVPTTLVLVGVADTVSTLIAGHASVVRNLREVRMPRMTEDELRAIVVKGWEQYQEKSGDTRRFLPNATAVIVSLSQGFPYYAHLLAGSAGAQAIRSGDSDVGITSVVASMVEAIDGTSQAMRELYADAVAARSGSQIERTLVACALAHTDELGFFTASSVSEPLERISGRARSTADYAHHLRRLVTGPGQILEERRRGERKVNYRFQDPLMKPFVLINALEKGLWRPLEADEDTQTRPIRIIPKA